MQLCSLNWQSQVKLHFGTGKACMHTVTIFIHRPFSHSHYFHTPTIPTICIHNLMSRILNLLGSEKTLPAQSLQKMQSLGPSVTTPISSPKYVVHSKFMITKVRTMFQDSTPKTWFAQCFRKHDAHGSVDSIEGIILSHVFYLRFDMSWAHVYSKYLCFEHMFTWCLLCLLEGCYVSNHIINSELKTFETYSHAEHYFVGH